MQAQVQALHRGKRVVSDSLEHESFDYPETKSQQIQVETTKISKKPHFLHVKYSQMDQVRQVRAKLWKVRSCKINLLERRIDVPRVDLQFVNILSHSTFKTSMKNVRKVCIGPNLRTTGHLYQLVPPSRRLITSLQVNLSERFINSSDFPQAMLSPRLKEVWIQTFMSPDFTNLIPRFRRCEDCKLRITHTKGMMIDLIANTNQLKSLSKLLKETQEKSLLSQYLVLNSPKAIEEVGFFHSFQDRPQDTKSPILPMMPNLKKLQIAWHAQECKFKQQDLAQYEKLESLSLNFPYDTTPESLDSLTSLTSLKKISFVLQDSEVPKEIFTKIPDLKNLHQFDVQFNSRSDFSGESLGNTLIQLKNLKTLGLEGNIQLISSILDEGNLDLPLDQLSVLVTGTAKTHKDAVKGLAYAIEKNKNLKSLHLSFTNYEGSVNDILLKATAKLNSLIALKLNFDAMPEMENNALKELKGVLSKNPGLKAFNLNLHKIPMTSRELTNLTDALANLKDLQKFFFEGVFQKISEASFQKFLDFIKSARNIKALKLSIQGLSTQQQYEFDQVLRKESCLWIN